MVPLVQAKPEPARDRGDHLLRRLGAALLDQHCAAVGRDSSTFAKTILGGGDAFTYVDAFLRSMEQYAAIGVDQVCLMPMGPDPVAQTAHLIENVLPRLSDISG